MEMPLIKILIQHENFGVLLDENFVNPSQLKLFLKMVSGCIELGNDLTFHDGNTFFVHIPHKYLVGSVIMTKNVDTYTLADHLKTKTKMEAPEIK